MIRTVVVTIQVDPTEYEQAVDTPEGAIDLVIDMLRGDADLSNEPHTFTCEHVTRQSGDHRVNE